MKACVLVLLALWASLHGALAFAGERELRAQFEQQRRHGYHSPAEASAALRGAAADIDRQSAPVRMEYLARLSAIYILSEQYAQFDQVIASLERMARQERCRECAYYVLIRKARRAINEEKFETLTALLAQLDAMPASADPGVRMENDLLHAITHEHQGDNQRAVEAAMRAARAGMALGDRSVQVRALNQLLLINIHRRDLGRAEEAGRDAFRLAEEIGYTFQMIYIRINQGWMYGTMRDSERQLAALDDALRLTRTQVGLVDVELLILINLADFHLGRKQFASAIGLNRQAIALAARHHKRSSGAIAMMSLGDAQFQSGQRAAGIATMEQSVRELAALGVHAYLINAYDGLIDAYAASARYREALQALRAQVALKERNMLAERDQAVSKVQAGFAAERKDREIERLSLESARHSAQAASRTWQQRWWAAAAIIFALCGILLLQAVRRMRSRNAVLETTNAELSDQSVHDPLTGAFNRRHCEQVMGQQAALLSTQQNQRGSDRTVGLVLLDVDHFKRINDSVGHAGGDAVLVEVARRLHALVRQQDVVVRWGGEEFVLVLPATSASGLLLLVERVLHVMGDQPMQAEGAALTVTVSAGAVIFPLQADWAWQDCLKLADAAMYLAKQGGRNQACCVTGVRADAVLQELVGDLGAAALQGQAVLQGVPGRG